MVAAGRKDLEFSDAESAAAFAGGDSKAHLAGCDGGEGDFVPIADHGEGIERDFPLQAGRLTVYGMPLATLLVLQFEGLGVVMVIVIAAEQDAVDIT